MGVSLVTFTITIVVEFRTFFLGIQCSFVIVLRHVDSQPRCWVGQVNVVDRARQPVFAQFLCSHLDGESILTVGLKNARLVVPHEELHVSLLQEIQDLEDSGDRLIFRLDDGRQFLLLDYLQSEFCFAQVRVHSESRTRAASS